MNKVLVVGAGLGGMTTALRLAKQGYSVEILEKNNQAGGRLNQIKVDGFTFDTGPSFFSMSYEFKEFAQACGIELPFEFVPLEPLYSVHFRDNPTSYHIFKDVDKMSAQFEAVEPGFKEKFRAYLKKTASLYKDTVDLVIKQNFDSVIGYLITLARVNPVHLPVLFKSFWKEVESNFDSQEAQQIVSLIAFFLGRTPFDTPAVYTLLSHIEFENDGYYNVKGGMYEIVNGLTRELEKASVKITYNTKIVDYRFEDKKLKSMIDDKGKQWTADAFVVNMDAALFRGRILKRPAFSEEKLAKMSWTMGYMTMYIGINQKLPNVNHHNYFLGTNYKDYAEKVMKQPDTPEKPYYYVNVLSKHNPECAPERCESLFFVCPVPNLLFKSDWSDKDSIADDIIDDFSQRIGVDVKASVVSRTIYSPKEWEGFVNLYKGSGLGLSHDLKQIGAFRPANKDEQFKNLFYVGASTVPGAGLPMAIISSKLTTERVVKYFR